MFLHDYMNGLFIFVALVAFCVCSMFTGAIYSKEILNFLQIEKRSLPQINIKDQTIETKRVLSSETESMDEMKTMLK